MPDVGPPLDSIHKTADSDRWLRINKIFADVVDLEPKDRSRYLSEVCAGDSSLIQEVERLILFNDKGDGPLDRCIVPEADASSELFAPGSVVCGRFRILRFIGRGGMGEVFAAEDLVLHETVAIKTIRPDFARDTSLVERLRREVQLSRKVSHRNVCRVFELWEHEDMSRRRVPFLTMELLEGEAFDSIVARRGPFPPREAIPLIREIACGLTEIHKAGLIHRDLKPSNLFLVQGQGEPHRVVVMDFGLARPVDPAAYSRTQTGRVFGTPAYMAPEQFESGQATRASDIYSFGVTIFEMITGHKHPLVPPCSLVKGIGPNWDEALRRCWVVNPLDRPEDPVEIADLIAFPARRLWPRLSTVSIILAAAVLLMAAAYELLRPANSQYRFEAVTADDGLSWEPSISSDGHTIAYASDSSNRGDLDIWVRHLDSPNPIRLTDNPANDAIPSLSPDGRQVVYNSDRTAKGIYIRSTGGGPERLVSSFGQEALFSPDGQLLLFWDGKDGEFSGAGSRIFTVRADGSGLRRIAADFRDARNPVWTSPGEILFEGCGPGCSDPETQREWWTISANSGHPVATGALQAILRQGLTPYFEAPAWRNGEIFFAGRMTNDTNIWRIPGRPPLIRSQWKAVPIMSSTEEATHPSFSRDGSMAFAGHSARVNLWTAPLSGRGDPKRLSANVEINSDPSSDRAGDRILYFRRRGNERRLILGSRDGVEILNVPVPAATRGLISPTGLRIAYTKPRGVSRDLYERRAPKWEETFVRPDSGDLLDIVDEAGVYLVATQKGILRTGPGSQSSVLVENGALAYDQASVSPVGELVAYIGNKDASHSQVFVAPLGSMSTAFKGAREVTSLLNWNDKPRWTSDGRAIVFLSDRDGFVCIWKQALGTDHEPHGPPEPVVHFHRFRLSPSNLSRAAFNLSVFGKELLYNIADMRSNVWVARPEK